MDIYLIFSRTVKINYLEVLLKANRLILDQIEDFLEFKDNLFNLSLPLYLV
jgi:hypothetical protein